MAVVPRRPDVESVLGHERDPLRTDVTLVGLHQVQQREQFFRKLPRVAKEIAAWELLFEVKVFYEGSSEISAFEIIIAHEADVKRNCCLNTLHNKFI